MARVLILGGTSWLAYHLIRALARDGAAADGIFATSRGAVVHPEDASVTLPVKDASDYLGHFEMVEPDVLVNLSRGEEELDFQAHAALAHAAARAGSYYFYASSAQVFDGGKGGPHSEDAAVKPESQYGVFKARCEDVLDKAGGGWGAVRFASTQGWAPHKPTRNTRFLTKMAQGESITVDRGVVQNRLYVDDLTGQFAAIIKARASGVFHLGTDDSSEELDFLKKQASAFGYDPALVQPGGERDVNLVTVPKRIFKLVGERRRRKESDTLASLRGCAEMQSFVNPESPL